MLLLNEVDFLKLNSFELYDKFGNLKGMQKFKTIFNILIDMAGYD